MQAIQVSDHRTADVTLLSDRFIEKAMPGANGDFLKIYIYLLSSCHHPERELSLSSIADVFACTEKDVLRALSYWEKEGLLLLSRSGSSLTGIAFPDFDAASPAPTQDAVLSGEKVTSAAVLQEPSEAAEPAESASVSLSSERIHSLKETDAEAQQILYVAETYLNRPLSRSDLECILYFYDTLHMSADLLEYLIEYCVMHQKTSIHYIRKVGLEWHRSGFTTVKEAREGSSLIRKEYYSVLNALGISGRKPVSAEIEAVDRWMNEYGFELPLILEACRRTVANTGGSSFAYTEGILSNWKKQNVHSMEDVQSEDNRYLTEKKKKASAKRESGRTASPNRFHNFHQRDYDYDELEKELLKKQW
ncbi:MAG: DnaD domain protein [Lachnospiraceae bacterium]|nr:DnaD domain protein [Lachnospiraceae bacterium]